MGTTQPISEGSDEMAGPSFLYRPLMGHLAPNPSSKVDYSMIPIVVRGFSEIREIEKGLRSGPKSLPT